MSFRLFDDIIGRLYATFQGVEVKTWPTAIAGEMVITGSSGVEHSREGRKSTGSVVLI